MVNTIQEYLKTRKPTVEDCALASVNTADGIRYVILILMIYCDISRKLILNY